MSCVGHLGIPLLYEEAALSEVGLICLNLLLLRWLWLCLGVVDFFASYSAEFAFLDESMAGTLMLCFILWIFFVKSNFRT